MVLVFISITRRPPVLCWGVVGWGEGTQQWKYEHVPHDRALRAVCKIDELNVVSAIVDVFFAPFICQRG